MELKCQHCNSLYYLIIENGKDFFVYDGISPSFDVAYCPKCMIGKSLPLMSDEELAQYYPDNFESFVPKKSLTANMQIRKYKSDLNQILKHLKYTYPPSLFEIGAGRGEFLSVAKNKGFVVTGLEPGTKGVEFAKANFNIDLITGYASSICFEKTYNVIVLRHVLEHINSYYDALNNIFNNGLLDTGVLFLKIPRLDSWEAKLFKGYWHGYDLPRHRNHFTKSGLRNILIGIGFKTVIFKNEVIPYDIIRSTNYYAKHGKNKLYQAFAKMFNFLPIIIRAAICQVIGVLLSPLGTGRMIVIAFK